jgi:ferric-dicitrate binding protein FerR (iron transport regulator)
MDSPTDDERREDDLMRRAFALTGRRPDVDPAALAHAEQVFRRALAPVVERTRRERRARWYSRGSLAAGFVVALGLGWLLARPTDPVVDEPIATLVAANGPVELLGTNARLDKGVRVGQALMTGAAGRASLRYRDADLRLDAATTVRFDATRLVLERGAVYIDTGTHRAPGEPSVLIETRFGMVGHTGTQFVARVDDTDLTVAVREGTVFVKADSDRRDLTAAPRGATIAVVGASGAIDIREGQPFDGLWAWVPRASSGFSADGRSVDDFVDWLSREYGYSVDYDDATAESRSKTTLLHGDLGGLPVDDALDAVSSTTDVRVVLASGTLRVASKGDHDSGGRNERQ